MSEILTRQWLEGIETLKRTGIFSEVSSKWTSQNGLIVYKHFEYILPYHISMKSRVLYLSRNPEIVLTAEKPFNRNRWYRLSNCVVNDNDDTWDAEEMEFEDVLASLEEDAQTKLLYHLDLFR